MGNLEDVLLRGVRASQPLATIVAEGSLYYVTDESIIEQSRGGVWVVYSYVLPATAVTPGIYGDATNIPQLTINAQGRITLAANVPVPAAAFVKIAEQTPSGVPSVTFSSLGAYTHLDLIWMGRGDTANISVLLKVIFNGDTGANYDSTAVYGNGSAGGTQVFGAVSADIGALPAATGDANMCGAGVLRIFNYRGTTFHKRATSNENFQRSTINPGQVTRQYAIGWRNTAAITSITVSLSADNFVAGSKFSLYGIQ